MTVCAVLEVQGIQQYIFGSNKLAEVVGASDMVRAVTDRIPGLVEEHDGHVISQTSGFVIFHANSRNEAVAVISKATGEALESAPGLNLVGAVSKEFEYGRGHLQAVAAETMRVLRSAQANRAITNLRSLQLPPVAVCQTTGQPAADISLRTVDYGTFLSRVSVAKRAARGPGRKRLRAMLEPAKGRWRFARDVDEIEAIQDRLGWLAVIHADTNGLGICLRSVAELSRGDEGYRDQLGSFVTRIEEVTHDALRAALNELADECRSVIPKLPLSAGGDEVTVLPVVPLVAGGDDVTLLCDAVHAIKLTRTFLEYLERASACDRDLLEIVLDHAYAAPRLSASAGVAIVKPHFPFTAAYALAEELANSAKQVKRRVRHASRKELFPCSSLDVRVIHDGAATDLTGIRERLEVEPGVRLWGGPFVVTPPDDLKAASAASKEWIRHRHIECLVERAKLVARKAPAGASGANGHTGPAAEEVRRLPATQLHALRSSLHGGRDVADRHFRELVAIDEMLGGDSAMAELGVPGACPRTLFWNDGDGEATTMLDVLELAPFLAP